MAFAAGINMSFSQSSAPTHLRRLSVSSSEDGLDLEASLASLGQIPENESLQASTADLRGSSTSPGKARRALANIFDLVKPGGSINSSFGPETTIWTSKSNYAYDTRILFKRRIATLYNKLTSLRAYAELNYSGFRKILKK